MIILKEINIFDNIMSKLSRGLIIVIIFLLLILHDPFSNSIVSQNYQLYCLAVVSIFESFFSILPSLDSPNQS